MDRTEFGKIIFDVMINEYDDLLIENVEHEFSPKFEKNIEKLINRRKKPYFRMINTFGKRVACIAACAVIASTTTVMSVDAIRNAVFNFFSDMFGSTSTVRVEIDKQHPKTIEEIYDITYDLSYYTIEREENNELFRKKIYIKDNIFVYYYQYTQDMFDGSVINTEDADIKETEINGFSATYLLDNQGNYKIIWDNGKYIFTILSNLNKEEAFEMAKSVQKVESG